MSADDTILAEGVLDEAMVQSMKQRIGAQLRIGHSVFNEEATRLAIARFAEGIGDPNPLWQDPEHAAAGPYGGLVAPPTWVICCFSGVQFGWPGLGSFHSGSALTFHRPVLLGDRITATCTYEGFDGPKASSFAERMVIDHFVNRYENQRGELVAEIRWSVINYERRAARARADKRRLELPHPWSDEELAGLEEEVLAERPRGREPRWWDDVHVGDELDAVVKGPIGTTDEVAYVASGAAPIPRLAAHGVALRNYRRHPGWAFRDPETYALEPVFAVHYNLQAALAMGVTFKYDVGYQRQCWHGHLLTNWIGDDGWVKQAACQYRGFVYLSDVVRLGGVVTAKYVDDDGDAVVEVETRATNQRGLDVMPGTATLALPAREVGRHPVRARLPSS